jgi:hypothetical protein
VGEDAGLYAEVEFDGWTGDGMDYPAKCARAAQNFRQLRDLSCQAAALPTAKARCLERIDLALKRTVFDYEPGDTIQVEYYDTADSTGLNALIMVTPPDLVRFVSQREYPPVLGQVVRRDQELVFDTKGTLEDDTDDEYHRLYHEEQRFGGEVATGTLAPVSGSGPLLSGVMARAEYQVQSPRFNPLQEWTSAVFTLDLGEFRSEGDEILYSVEATVHWRSDAEHYALLEVPGGGPIETDSIVEAKGRFTAAPTNQWLEAICDTLDVQVGDLDDESDDLLYEVSRKSTFDGVAVDGGSPRHYVHYLPDEPVAPGEEPCGGEAQQEIWYPQTWWLVHLLRELDIECDGSGSLHVLMEMRDDTSYERWITWDGAGGATLTEERQDGTRVTGSWNEKTGEYSLQTSYPDGHDPVARDQHGLVRDDFVEAWDIYTWQDAHPDSTYFTRQGDDTSFTAEGYKIRGDLREDFTLTYQEGERLAGSWTRNDGAHGEFTIEEIEGGGQHLIFSATDPTEPGEPVVSGEIWFAPDGSGHGTITITQYGVTVNYEITFGPDGTGQLRDGEGNVIPLS